MSDCSIRLQKLILQAAAGHTLKKVIFSKPEDPTEKKAVLTLRLIGGREQLQLERFCTDNKALHENLPLTANERLEELIASHGQINLLTAVGECELRRAKKSGTETLLGGDKLAKALQSAPAQILPTQENNREKQHILTGDEPFLKRLDVADVNGRIRDKKQAKFRQINRFLELIRDCLTSLPADGTLRICDLCCGKSYLSFAAYHYFTNILGRKVHMTGVDLKPDVIAHCSAVASDLGFDGLEFLCGDVSQYEAGEKVHLVISLHACDIATDLVLSRAVAWNTDVILSTPCCHHELNHHFNCSQLAFIAEHSMLRQKLCDAATDALRLKFLEANGYAVTALELIDPEETPKNIMLRGLRKPNFSPTSPAAKRAAEEYEAARSFLTGGTNCVQSILCPSVWREEKS